MEPLGVVTVRLQVGFLLGPNVAYRGLAEKECLADKFSSTLLKVSIVYVEGI